MVDGLFLFEFMDLRWIPDSLRSTIHDALDSCLGASPRQYYDWVAREILALVEQNPAQVIVELGAGAAPITRALADALKTREDISLRISDLYPDEVLYVSLEKSYKGRIQAELKPVDFCNPIDVPPQSLLVLSAAFHHVPPTRRMDVLKSLSAHRVAIFEPLRPNPASICLSLLGFLPALMTPLRFWNQRPGNFRRVLWCWLLPAATAIIVWDGLVSCLRCWTGNEWVRRMAQVTERPVFTKSDSFSQMIAW